MSEEEQKKEAAEKEKIGQLLNGTDLSPQDIAKQLNIPIRKVYRHRDWQAAKERRRQKTKLTEPRGPPSTETPHIEFEQRETLPTDETTAPIPGLETKEAPKIKEPTEPEIAITLPEYGAFKGLIDTGFEVLCETAGLTKPNPVKIEKLDHAVVDFCKAWQIDFRDPRILPTIVLAGTVGEIALPMIAEIRAKRAGKPKEKEPTTPTEKALAAEIPGKPETTPAMAERIGQALA
jgi:hypothetical protein